MTIDEIKELIRVLQETGIAELEVQRGENRVRIRSNAQSLSQDIVVPNAGSANGGPVNSRTDDPRWPAGSGGRGWMVVKSPIVGTYYDSPSPGSAPFVKVGDQVEPGKVLCIIESMKLMNEIEAETAGTVIAKLVENGRAGGIWRIAVHDPPALAT